ncbi:MAG: GTP 3',8-cyclase MoaA [Acidimicrobiia bacterium]|nr:GTP 3',8-cyclase MoaA [Acidimicrobiia bacterium]
MLKDTRNRALKDLRISVTDRCNFRCRYCMPKEIFSREYEFLSRDLLLSFEELTRLTAIAVGAGVEKVRITGGEPLLRKDLEQLIAMLGAIDGLADITLTTNGVLLDRKADALAAAGLRRVTVSLDSLDDEVFMQMNDVGFPVQKVLDGIEAAAGAGLAPIKVNMVVKRGVNDHSVLEMAEHFRGTGHVVRFIEYMDVGTTNGWRLDDVVPAVEILEQIGARYPLEPVDANYPGEVARRWRYADGAGEIGVITSVTQPFCSTCTRARISADGRLYTCLFAAWGHDLRGLLRSGASDREIAELLRDVWSKRDDNYSERRSTETAGLDKVEMSYIGG